MRRARKRALVCPEADLPMISPGEAKTTSGSNAWFPFATRTVCVEESAEEAAEADVSEALLVMEDNETV